MPHGLPNMPRHQKALKPNNKSDQVAVILRLTALSYGREPAVLCPCRSWRMMSR